MTPDAQARRVAESQRSHIRSDQLRACGLTPKQIHHRKKRGELLPVLPGVFRLGGVPESFESRLSAISLWMGDAGFFNAATAGYLLRLDGIDRPDVISVALSTGHRSQAVPWLKVCRINRSVAPPTRWVEGFRICHTERVLAECAAILPARQVGRGLDDALRRRLTTLNRMQAFVGSWRGRPGAKVLRKLLAGRDDRDEKVRSLFESKMLSILRRIPKHRFVPNFEVQIQDERYFLDFYLPSAKLGIECHSFKWHIGRHNEDARRDRRIRSLGIEIIYFTWDDVCFHADEVVTEIRAVSDRRIAITPR